MPVKIIKSLQYVLIIIAVITCGIFFRLYPITYNLHRKNISLSRLMVYINMRRSITEKINESYPTLSAEEKQAVADKKFKEMLSEEARNIEKAALEMSKNMRDKTFKYYLLGADSYYYYYLTKDLLKGKQSSLSFKNGKYHDPLIKAPVGHWRKIEIHPFIGLFTYRFLKFFNSEIPLMQALSFVPLILSALAVIIFVLLCALLKIRPLIIFVSGIFFYLSPIFIQRSSLGWYDSDPYNIIIPLTTILLLLKVLEKKSRYIWTFLLSILSAVYALFWQGWIFLPLFASISFIAVITNAHFAKKDPSHTLKRFLLYILTVPLFASAILTPEGFIDSIKDVLSIVSGFLLLDTNIWPDIFLTVGELKTPSLERIMYILGGFIFLSLSATGIFISFLSPKSKLSREQTMVLLLFYLCFILMARNAERFIIFLLTPASIYFAVALQKLSELLESVFLNIFKNKSLYALIANWFTFCILLIIPLIYGHAIALKQNPIFNDVWNKTLVSIRSNTPPQSIVDTWWPPGHFIKAVSERGVAFDGATINTPQAYWMASFFLAENEKEALGIIRKLNCNGNQATELLLENNFSLDKAIALIKRIVVLERTEAENVARQYLTEDKAENLISLTHCTPPPSYCLIYKELMENTIGLYYVKKWDFRKAAELQKTRQAKLNKGGFFWRGTKDNISKIWDIAGGTTYIGQEVFQMVKSGNVVRFGNGVILDTRRMEARIEKLENNVSGIPRSILYIKNGKFIEKDMNNSTLRLSVLFIEHPDKSYSCVVAPPEVLKSVLFRLYYLEGTGFDHFQKVIQEEDPRENTKIIVYKITFD